MRMFSLSIILVIGLSTMTASCGKNSGGPDLTPPDSPLPPAEDVQIDSELLSSSSYFGRENSFTYNSQSYFVLRTLNHDARYLGRLTASGKDISFGTEGLLKLTGELGILNMDTSKNTSLIKCNNQIYSLTDKNAIHELIPSQDGKSFSSRYIGNIFTEQEGISQEVRLFCTDSHLTFFHLNNGSPERWGVAFLNLSTDKFSNHNSTPSSFPTIQGAWSHGGKIYLASLAYESNIRIDEATLDEENGTATLEKSKFSLPSLANQIKSNLVIQSRDGKITVSGVNLSSTIPKMSFYSSDSVEDFHAKVESDTFTTTDLLTFDLPILEDRTSVYEYNICSTSDLKNLGIFMTQGPSYLTAYFVIDVETKEISQGFNSGVEKVLSPFLHIEHLRHSSSYVNCIGNSIYFGHIDSTTGPSIMTRYSF